MSKRYCPKCGKDVDTELRPLIPDGWEEVCKICGELLTED